MAEGATGGSAVRMPCRMTTKVSKPSAAVMAWVHMHMHQMHTGMRMHTHAHMHTHTYHTYAYAYIYAYAYAYGGLSLATHGHGPRHLWLERGSAGQRAVPAPEVRVVPS